MGFLHTVTSTDTSRGPRFAPGGAVDLLDADAGFGQAIPHADIALARRVLNVPRLDAATGPWEAPPSHGWRGPVSGLLVVDGALCRHVGIAERIATQFLDPGDVLQPWGRRDDSLPSTERYTVHERVTFAVLDGRFALAAAKWPKLTALLVDRMSEQCSRASVHTAIAQLPRVEQRVLAMLWQLADRFGRVCPEGVAVELRLTHALIGQCVGARRPTVTLALRALVEDGLLVHRSDGAWVLSHDSRAVLEDATAPVAQIG